MSSDPPNDSSPPLDDPDYLWRLIWEAFSRTPTEAEHDDSLIDHRDIAVTPTVTCHGNNPPYGTGRDVT